VPTARRLGGSRACWRCTQTTGVNVEVVDSHRGSPLELARRELAEAHQALLDRLAAYSLEQWCARVPGSAWPDGRPMTLASVFAYRYHGLTHYGDHVEELEAWLREHGS